MQAGTPRRSFSGVNESVDEESTSSDGEWDTDLEETNEISPVSVSLKQTYIKACYQFRVPPVTKFIKQMDGDIVDLKHYGILDNGAQAVAMTMSKNVTVATLNLHDNGIQVPGAVAIARMLKENDFVARLDLSGNKIGGKGVRGIARMLLENITLRELNLSNNRLIHEDISLLCETLKENSHLKVLNLSYNDLGEQAGTIIGSTLSVNKVLESLDVSWNRILGKGIISLAEGVKESQSLKELNIAWNGFSDVGAHALRRVLEENDSLISLDIASNSIGLDGTRHLGKGLKRNKTIKVLRAGKNPFLSAGAFVLLQSILKNKECALEELYLENIVFDKECKKAFDKVLRRRPNFSCTWDVIIEGGRLQATDEPEATMCTMDKFIQFVRTRGLRIGDLYRTLSRGDSLKESNFVRGLKGMNVQMGDREIRELFSLIDENKDNKLQFSEFTSILNTKMRERDAQKKERKVDKHKL